MADAVVEEYESSLADLTFNSKPHINMLTMLAEENVKYAPHIVRLIEAQLNKATSSEKLPVMYLMDSIVKNVGGDYCTLFSQNIVSTFCNIFEQVDEKTRMSLYKLRSTWDTIFTAKKLYALDSRVQGIDPAWPVKPLPAELQVSTSIHVNPKFLKKQESDTAAMQQQLQEQQEQLLRSQLIAKQQELLKMQQARLEMELLQTRAKLEEQTKTLRPQVPQQPAVQMPSFSQVTTPMPATSVPTSSARDPRLASRDPRIAKQPGASSSQPVSTMPQYNTGAFPSTSMAAQSWLASGTQSPTPQTLVGGAGPLAERISATQQKRGGEPITVPVPVEQPAVAETSSSNITEKKPSPQKVQKPQEKSKTKTEPKVSSPKKSSTSTKDQKGKDTKSKDNKDKAKKDDSKSKPVTKSEKKDDKKKDEKKVDTKSTRGKRNYRTRRSDEDNKDEKDSKSRDDKDKKDEQKSLRNEKSRSSTSSSRRGSRSSPERSTRRRSTSKSSSHSPRAKSRSRSPVRRHSSRSISPKDRRSSRSGRQDRTPPRSSRMTRESSKDKDDKPKAKTSDNKSRAGTKRSMEKENKSKVKKEPQETKAGNKYEQSQDYDMGSPKFSPEPESDPEEPVAKRFRSADRDFPRRAWPLPLQSNVRQEPRARRPSISSLPRIPRKPAGTPSRRLSIDPDLKIPKELTLEKQQQILKQAEEQFRNNQLSHEQYQEMLKQLHELYELQRLRQQQMQQRGDGQVLRLERREDGARGGRMARGRGRGLLPTPPSPWAELKRQPSTEAKSPWAEYKKSHPSEREFQFPVKEEKDAASEQAQQAYMEHRKKLEERKSYLEHKSKLRKTSLYFDERGWEYPSREYPMDIDERQGAAGRGRAPGLGPEGIHRRALLPYLGQQDGSPRPLDDGRREDPRLRRTEDRGAPEFRNEEDRRRWEEWKKFDDEVCKQWNLEYRKWEEEIKKWEDSGRQGPRPLAPHEVYGQGKQEFDPKKEEEYRRWQDDIRRWEHDGMKGPPPPAPQESLPLGPELLDRLENDRRQWDEDRAKYLKELSIWEQKMDHWKKFGTGPPPQRPQEPEHPGLPVDRRWEEDRRRFEEELRKWDADMEMWEKNGRRGTPPLRPKEPSLPTSTNVVFMERRGFPSEGQFDRPSRTWEEDHRRWEEDMRRWEQGGRKGNPPQEPLRPSQQNQRSEDRRRWEQDGRKGQFERPDERWQEDHRRWEEDMRRWEQDGRKGQPPQEPLPPPQFDKAKLEAEHRRWHESRRRFETELKKWEENGRRVPPPPSHMDLPPPLGPEMPEVARKQWKLDCQHWQDQMRGWEQGGRQGPPPSPPYHLLSQALEINDAARRQWEEDHRRWEEDMKRWEADGRRGLPPQEPVMQMPGVPQHSSALQKPEPEWREFEEKHRQWEEDMRRWEAGGRRGAPPVEPVPPRVQSPGMQNRNAQWEEEHRKWQDDMKRWELDGRRGMPPIEPVHPSNQQGTAAAAQRDWEQRHRRWQDDMRRWEADGRRGVPPPEPQPPRLEEEQRREAALREWESNCRQWEEDMRRWEDGGKRGSQPIKPVLHLPQPNMALVEWESQHRRWKEDMQSWEMDGRRGVPPPEPRRPPDQHPDNSLKAFQERHRMWEQDMDRWEKGGRKGQAPLEPLPPLPPKNVLSEEERKKLDEEHHMWEEAMTRWVEGGRMGPPPRAPGEQEDMPMGQPRPLIPGLSGARMGGPRMDGPGPRMDGPGPRMDGPGPRMDGPGPRMDGPGPGPRMDGPGLRMDGPGPRMDGPGHRMPGPGFRMDGPMHRPGQFGMMQPGMVSSAPGPMMSGPGPIMSGPMGGMPFSGPPNPALFGNMVMGVATTMQLMGQMGMPGQPIQGRPMQPMPGPSHMSMGPMPGIPDHHPPMPFGMPPPAPGPAPQPAKLDVSQLFEKLLKTGIIKKVDEKKEEPKVEEQKMEAKTEEVSRVVVPLEERMEEDEPRAELKLDTTVPPLALKVEDLKTRHKGVINRLYCGIQCSSCGSRFLPEETDKYANHLDWHFRMNRREKEGTGKASHRDWYYGVDDWIAYAELGDDEEDQESAFFEQPVVTSEPGEVISCPVCTDEENDDICDICQEPFEQFWDEEEEAWHLKDAVRVNGKARALSSSTFHPNCYEDYDESFLETPTPADAPKESPLEAQIKMEAAQVKEEPMDAAEEEKPSTSAMQPLSTIKEIPFLSEEAQNSDSKEQMIVKEEVSESMEVGETEQVKTEMQNVIVKEEPKSPASNQCEAPAQVENVTVKKEPENVLSQLDNNSEQTTDQINVKQEVVDNPVETEPSASVSDKKDVKENVAVVLKESVEIAEKVEDENVTSSPVETPLDKPKVEPVDESKGQAISTIGGGNKIPVVGSASPLRGSAISVVGGGSSPARFRSNSPMHSIPVIGASSSPKRTAQATANPEAAKKPKTGSFFKLDPSAKTK
ncbi:mRNA 3' end processing factor [Branchiostoma belcheri]|nr:mRNA 3' end processing factor [Branchiostoma belcheri]